MSQVDTRHPQHNSFYFVGGYTPVQKIAKPARASWWTQWKAERACRKAGGRWWHPEGMIDWFCCQCGAETSGMPKDGE